MTKKDKEIKELLDIEVNSRNTTFEINYDKKNYTHSRYTY